MCPGYTAGRVGFNLDGMDWKNITWSLSPGSWCEIKVDARKVSGRVVFPNTYGYIGIVLVDGQAPKTVEDSYAYDFTFEKGINKVRVYNGAPDGPITIDIAFTDGIRNN